MGGVQGFDRVERAGPEDPPLTQVPEVSVSLTLTMPQGEVGEFTLDGGPNLFFPKGAGAFTPGKGPYASGRKPAALTPDNRAANRRLDGDPALSRRVTICPHSAGAPALTARRAEAGGEAPVEPKVITADMLEVLHQATGLPIVADYYTHLYQLPEVSVRDMPLFETLNRLSEAMRLR